MLHLFTTWGHNISFACLDFGQLKTNTKLMTSTIWQIHLVLLYYFSKVYKIVLVPE